MLRTVAKIVGCAVLVWHGVCAAATLDTVAQQAYLVDDSTGTVLLDKNSTQRMPTSSMSKMLTIYLVFERLKAGDLKLDDQLLVSEKAWRMGGSRMFVEVGKKVKVEDLIRGVILQSGNDACIVLAEGIAGTESAFVEKINEKAKELGMKDSHFMNATGWPDPDHYSTARDLALLARRLIHDFPEYYPYFSEEKYAFNNIAQDNRDPILGRVEGADGLKTGHTEAGGYGFTGSAVRKGRRLIMVLNGMPSTKARIEESVKVMEWGFRSFETYPLFKADQIVETAPVAYGAESEIPLVVGRDFGVTLERDDRAKMVVKVIYDTPLQAPLTAGQAVGKVVVTAPHLETMEVPLLTTKAVEKAGFFGRLIENIGHLFGG